MRPLHLTTVASLLIASRALAQLAGDECSNALPAVVGSNGPVNTSTMTPSANAPANDGCSYLNWNNSKDVWWVFNAPSNGLLTVELCGSDFDTSLVIYQGSCGALTRIACDDDSCAPAGPLYQSKVSRLVVSRGPVYVRVGGYGGLAGNASMNLAFAPVGAATCWGKNDADGRLFVPADLGMVSAINSGGAHTIALTTAGSVRCWGSNAYGQCTVPAGLGTATAIAAGAFHNMALSTSGAVTCWGDNATGQCTVPAGLGTVSAIAAGGYWSMALTASGAVRAWGGMSGFPVPADLGVASAIAAGSYHGMAVVASGAVRCWGTNSDGQCNVPADLGTVRAIAAGSVHSMALTSTGTVRCWGNNADGQCNVPAGLGSVSAIAAGSFHSMALSSTGTVRCWGRNNWGQCDVPGVLGAASAISGGPEHCAAISIEDCNANGTADAFELSGHDCNGNSRLDACDATNDILEDCNANGLGDTCEKQLTVAIGTWRPNVGRGHPFTWTVANAVRAVAPVTLRVRGHGDFSGALEYLRIRIGSQVDVHALGGTTDCAASPVAQYLTIDPEDFNLGIDSAGVLRVIVEPADAVDAAGCNDGTWVSLNLDYTGASAADCNANGVLDACEIAGGWGVDANGNGVLDACEVPFSTCPPDFDGNAKVDGADLGVLLASWGPAGAGTAADLNRDGAVDGADLGTLLGAWGNCAN